VARNFLNQDRVELLREAFVGKQTIRAAARELRMPTATVTRYFRVWREEILQRRRTLRSEIVMIDRFLSDLEHARLVAGKSAGGNARAARLSPERRQEIAKEAARQRWHG
jgi:hypothetical protein